MEWLNQYPQSTQPTQQDMVQYVRTPLFNDLRDWIEKSYHSAPAIEYSACSAQPGWNMKYKKGSKAITTLYPMDGYFIAMITIAPSKENEAALLLPELSDELKALFDKTRAMPRMGRWLMIEVSNEAVLSDVKRLIELRIGKPK